jgi:hypothetical protein
VDAYLRQQLGFQRIGASRIYSSRSLWSSVCTYTQVYLYICIYCTIYTAQVVRHSVKAIAFRYTGKRRTPVKFSFNCVSLSVIYLDKF